MAASNSSRPLLFQCALCKELTTLTQFWTSSDGLLIRCDECQGESFYASPSGSEDALERSQALLETQRPAAEPPPSSLKSETLSAEEKETRLKSSKEQPVGDPGAGDDVEEAKRCPKCASVVSVDRSNCPRCGLSFSNIGVTFGGDLEGLAKTPLEKAAITLWMQVLENWEDKKEHEAFIQYCVQHQLLELAASCYRRERNLREDDEIAEKQLARLVELVQQQFLVFQQQDQGGAGDSKLPKTLLTIFFFVAMFMLFFYMFRSLSTPLRIE